MNHFEEKARIIAETVNGISVVIIDTDKEYEALAKMFGAKKEILDDSHKIKRLFG